MNDRKQVIAQAKARLEPLQRETASMETQLAETKKEITRREAELAKARLQLEEQSAGLPDLAALRQELNDLRKAETRLIVIPGPRDSRSRFWIPCVKNR